MVLHRPAILRKNFVTQVMRHGGNETPLTATVVAAMLTTVIANSVANSAGTTPGRTAIAGRVDSGSWRDASNDGWAIRSVPRGGCFSS
jgi:hypothetical protein